MGLWVTTEHAELGGVHWEDSPSCQPCFKAFLWSALLSLLHWRKNTFSLERWAKAKTPSCLTQLLCSSPHPTWGYVCWCGPHHTPPQTYPSHFPNWFAFCLFAFSHSASPSAPLMPGPVVDSPHSFCTTPSVSITLVTMCMGCLPNSGLQASYQFQFRPRLACPRHCCSDVAHIL